jgi:FKBP-type peptidyl-prolyl cis-trans isomerase FkpA
VPGAKLHPAQAGLVELLDFIPESVLRQMQAQQSMMGGGVPGGMPGGAPGAPSPR